MPTDLERAREKALAALEELDPDSPADEAGIARSTLLLAMISLAEDELPLGWLDGPDFGELCEVAGFEVPRMKLGILVRLHAHREGKDMFAQPPTLGIA